MSETRRSELPVASGSVGTPNSFSQFKPNRTHTDDDVEFQSLVERMDKLWQESLNEHGVVVFDEESASRLKEFGKYLLLVDVIRTSQRRLDFCYFGAGRDVVIHNGRDFTGNLIRHLIFRNLRNYRVGGHQSDITVLYECAVEEGVPLEFEGNFLTPSEPDSRPDPAKVTGYRPAQKQEQPTRSVKHDLKRINVYIAPISTDGLNRDFLIGLALIRDEYRN